MMSIRGLAGTLAIGAMSLAMLTGVPATVEANTQAKAAKPLQLNNFKRKPVASSAAQAAKKKSGEYAKVAIKPKKRAGAAIALAATTAAAAPAISPAAAQAFASYETARVRVITPEETALLTSAASVTASPPGTVENVQIVDAGELNHIDQQADSAQAVSLDALVRNLNAGSEPTGESQSWLQRLMILFGTVFAAVATLMRTLLG